MSEKGTSEPSSTSIVEDVFIPRSLLATAKFDTPLDKIHWERSLPNNDRLQYVDATEHPTGLGRSVSLRVKTSQKEKSFVRRSISLSGRTKPTLGRSGTGIKRSGSLSFLQTPTRPATSRLQRDQPLIDEIEDAPLPVVRSNTLLDEKDPAVAFKEKAVYPTSMSSNSSTTTVDSDGSQSLQDVYEKAKLRGVALKRRYWVRLLFEYSLYAFLVLFIYFVLVGMPLWRGAVWWLYWVVSHKFVIQGGWAITIGLAFLYAFLPLLILFESDPPSAESIVTNDVDLESNTANAKSTALLIPCYKSAKIIGPTLKAALKVFPPENIFVIANGNSETPLDDTEEVCRPYGVNHLWVPVGSKIVAQFAGCYAAKGFENVLLIDDDCALPPNFPIVCDRLKGKVKCIGYTIKSVGPNSSKGTYCQQAQDLEYKMSGLQRAFFGKLGSATFPHGAISIWNTEFLKMTFNEHPGFSVSEDWFFGDSCRRLGGRIKMCSSVFVETETPASVFYSGGGGSRGGFGEMTIFQQRFKRWNFFFVIDMYYDMKYILTSWKLGWWEIGAKLCVFQEVYETLIYLLAPFMLPIAFVIRPSFCGILLGATIGMYIINVIIFNEIHLRLKNERIAWLVLIFYYTFYKIALTFINVVSCYWSLYKYARYFAMRHPKVIEDEHAVQVVLSLEQEAEPPQTLPGIAEGEVATPTENKRASQRMSLILTKAGNLLSR
ncbi:hypothetical protein N7495_001055 [Penicillium taxi]|uniref:uncharacterized protein n=1 Tax=Penicillium taxi TaxID=168475 RepID=UPI002545A1A4|nr:uncharacterized protein N7495_001055 [Penicillium taxi]KAJ5908373.1 hypothetical protein N7495_001055 [Penicillium taxi]